MISQGKLKQRIKDMTKNGAISHEILYQNFFFERFLERLSKSEYRHDFILKGGFLLTALLGLENRNTADIDMSIESINMDEAVIRQVINDICDVEIKDNTHFDIINITKIRHEDKYNGLRVTLLGFFYSLKFHFKIDLSTGDQITPEANFRKIRLNIIEKSIALKTYNFETVLAEKVETILSRGTGNTRAKDFFDVYAILIEDKAALDFGLLQKAFTNTMNYRNSMMNEKTSLQILSSIKNSTELSELWYTYRKQALYVPDISFNEILDVLENLLRKIYRI